MAEPRRVNLMPVEAPDVAKKDKKPSRVSRFSVALTESNDKSCPEFSYAELVKNSLDKKREEKKKAKLDKSTLDDPFGEDAEEDEHLKALAQQLEEKYGPKPGKKSKKQRFHHVSDMVDLGDGYDETDAFIDNSEAYDELVPDCMTTSHGGFYINTGKLDFKFYSDVESDDDFENLHKQKKKKLHNRIDSESDGEVVVRKRGRPKKKPELGVMQKVKKRKKKFMSLSDPERSFKKTKFDKCTKLKKTSGDDGGPAAGMSPQQNGLAPPISSAAAAGASEPVSSPPSTLLDSDNSLSESENEKTTTSNINDVGTKNNSNSNSFQGKSTKTESPEESRSHSPCPETAPDLPDGLSPSLLEKVLQLKLAAKQNKEGKCKFFSGEVNNLLLHIENSSRSLRTRQRLALYSHLVAYLPCGLHTLMKRAKNLWQNHHDNKLRNPIEKLREAIERVMPALIEKHQHDTTAVLAAKQEKIQEVKEAHSSESDDDTEKGDKRKGIRGPRKKFEWTSEMRSLVCDIVRIKMDHYDAAKIRAQSPELYLRAFLDAEIRPLWPQGWMQTRMLFKESRAIHGRWTVLPNKPKKTLLLSKTMTPGSSLPNSAANTPTSMIKSSPLSALTPTSTPTVKVKDTLPNISSETTPKLEYRAEMKPVKPSPTLLDYAGESYSSYAKSKVSNANENMPNASITMGVTTNTLSGSAGSGAIVTSSLLAKALKTEELEFLQPQPDHSQSASASARHANPVTPSTTKPQATTPSDFYKKFEEFAKASSSMNESLSVNTSLGMQPVALSSMSGTSATSGMSVSPRATLDTGVHDVSKRPAARPIATMLNSGNGSYKSNARKMSVNSKQPVLNKPAGNAVSQLPSDTAARSFPAVNPNSLPLSSVSKPAGKPSMSSPPQSSIKQLSNAQHSTLQQHLTAPLSAGMPSSLKSPIYTEAKTTPKNTRMAPVTSPHNLTAGSTANISDAGNASYQFNSKPLLSSVHSPLDSVTYSSTLPGSGNRAYSGSQAAVPQGMKGQTAASLMAMKTPQAKIPSSSINQGQPQSTSFISPHQMKARIQTSPSSMRTSSPQAMPNMSVSPQASTHTVASMQPPHLKSGPNKPGPVVTSLVTTNHPKQTHPMTVSSTHTMSSQHRTVPTGQPIHTQAKTQSATTAKQSGTKPANVSHATHGVSMMKSVAGNQAMHVSTPTHSVSKVRPSTGVKSVNLSGQSTNSVFDGSMKPVMTSPNSFPAARAQSGNMAQSKPASTQQCAQRPNVHRPAVSATNVHNQPTRVSATSPGNVPLRSPHTPVNTKNSSPSTPPSQSTHSTKASSPAAATQRLSPQQSQKSPQSQAKFGGLTLEQLHAQTLAAAQKVGAPGTGGGGGGGGGPLPSKSNVTSRVDAAPGKDWHSVDKVATSSTASTFNRASQAQAMKQNSVSPTGARFQHPAASSALTSPGYQSLRLSDIAKHSPPPLSHPPTPPAIPRSPDLMSGGSGMYSYDRPRANHPNMQQRSPSGGLRPHSMFPTLQGSPRQVLPQSQLGYHGHPFADPSQNQHRY